MLSNDTIRKKSKRDASNLINHVFNSKKSKSCSNANLEPSESSAISMENDPNDINVDVYETENLENEVDYEVLYSEEDGEDMGDENSCETMTANINKLREKLCCWSIKHCISNVAVNEMLSIFRDCNINVPKDVRTLKKTPKDVVARPMGPGTYVHYGLSDALTDFLCINKFELQTIELDVNIDGLPLFKSSSKQVWPILCSVVNTSDVLFIGAYEGYTKPKSADEYLSEFITELNTLIQEGLHYERKTYEIKMRCFIMDAPARSFIIGTKGHTGYYSCIRCTQKGQMFKNRVVFPITTDSSMRCNETFRSRNQPEHHNEKGPTILETLQIDMVKQIALDYMHVVCLGVTRTLLNAWVKKKGDQFSLTSWKVEMLSNSLVNIRACIPSEFNRKPRALKDLDSFKATELRQFLLYTGPYLLKQILTPERYHHFLNLSVAIRILLDDKNCIVNNKCAENLLHNFVQKVPELYDLSFLTCNFHCLLHIHEDAKLYGSLEGINAFKYENHLQQIKKSVKKSNHVASQLYNRQVEKSLVQESKPSNTAFWFGRKVGDSFASVKLEHFSLAVKRPNNYCLVNNKVIEISKIQEKNFLPFFEGHIIRNLQPYFQQPIESDKFNIYCTSQLNRGESTTFYFNKIEKKIISLEDLSNNIHFFTPYIH